MKGTDLFPRGTKLEFLKLNINYPGYPGLRDETCFSATYPRQKGFNTDYK